MYSLRLTAASGDSFQCTIRRVAESSLGSVAFVLVHRTPCASLARQQLQCLVSFVDRDSAAGHGSRLHHGTPPSSHSSVPLSPPADPPAIPEAAVHRAIFGWAQGLRETPAPALGEFVVCETPKPEAFLSGEAPGFRVVPPSEPAVTAPGMVRVSLHSPVDEDGLLDFVSFDKMTERLNADLVLDLLLCLLTEQRIVLVSGSLERLTNGLSCIDAMLLPLAWQYVFIPILPQSLLDYLTAPMPFVIGLLDVYVGELSNDARPMEAAFVLHLDTGRVLRSDSLDALKADLPAPLMDLGPFRRLSLRIGGILDDRKRRKRTGRSFDVAFSRALLQFFVELLGLYEDFLGKGPPPSSLSKRKPVHFDKDGFAAATAAAAEADDDSAALAATETFVRTHVCDSQLFEAFLRERETVLDEEADGDDARDHDAWRDSLFEAARVDLQAHGDTTQDIVCRKCGQEDAAGGGELTLRKGRPLCESCIADGVGQSVLKRAAAKARARAAATKASQHGKWRVGSAPSSEETLVDLASTEHVTTAAAATAFDNVELDVADVPGLARRATEPVPTPPASTSLRSSASPRLASTSKRLSTQMRHAVSSTSARLATMPHRSATMGSVSSPQQPAGVSISPPTASPELGRAARVTDARRLPPVPLTAEGGAAWFCDNCAKRDATVVRSVGPTLVHLCDDCDSRMARGIQSAAHELPPKRSKEDRKSRKPPPLPPKPRGGTPPT